MEERQFGDSNLTCSALGFGTWAMGTTQYGPIDVEEVTRAVHAAIDHGITLIDTAEAYGPFIAEEILGKVLGPRRKDVVLVTKVGFLYEDDSKAGEPKIIGRDSKPASVISHTEDCLRRLKTDFVDLMLIHWPDHDTPIPETMEALEELKQAGKIRHYGVSNYTVEMMAQCEAVGHLTANQVGYNLFDRRMESAVLPYCLAHDIGFMAYGSLGFGLLSGAFTPETAFVEWDWRSKGDAFGLPLFERENFLAELRVVERLKGLADDAGKSVAQLAIAWVLGNPAVTTALVGVRNDRELAENIAAADWRLPSGLRAQIDLLFEEEGVPTYMDAEQAV
jgi:aryl-alcohol dehydrogenase-like predicted oxidoreductase